MGICGSDINKETKIKTKQKDNTNNNKSKNRDDNINKSEKNKLNESIHLDINDKNQVDANRTNNQNFLEKKTDRIIQNSEIEKGDKIEEENKKLQNNESFEPKKEDIMLRLKPKSFQNIWISKDPKDMVLNSKYLINLKVTIKKVVSSAECKVSLYQYASNEFSGNKNLLDTSETRTINKNQTVTFTKQFLVKFNFTKIQPLEFVIDRNHQNDILQINLGELISKPRQIYLHNFPNYDFQVEAIVNNIMQKKIIFLVVLSGNIKSLKLFYTISTLGNRYGDSKKELVYKSDTMKHDNEIFFPSIELPLEKLSVDNNLEDNIIQIAFHKINESTNEEIGKEELSIEQLFQKKEIELNLSGKINAKILCRRKNFFNFLQFLYNDFHLLTTFCIDFSKNATVHNNNQILKNLLDTFLKTLVPYNIDTFFHCFAYGFTLNETGESHINDLFPLNRKTPSIDITNILPKYEKFLTKIKKEKNETRLELIIKNINNSIKEKLDLEDKEYNLFIIFICNDIENEQDFIEELMKTCTLNISIVIIGIGSRSFNKIKTTINDIKDNVLKRNCVKFIKINEKIGDIVNDSLIDIPDAMIDFFCENNIIPTI